MNEVEAKLKEKIERFTHAVHKMTPAQRLVIKLAARGLDNDDIARELSVPVTTILGRMHAVYQAAQIPANVSTRKGKRQILIALYRGFAEQYDVNHHGFVVGKPVVRQPAPIAPPAPTPAAPSIPDVQEVKMPLPNGHAEKAANDLPPKPVQEHVPARVVPGYGVGLTHTLADPISIADIVPVTLGTPEAPAQLQKLLQDGYVPEVMNDFQSLTSARGVTKIFFIKRK